MGIDALVGEGDKGLRVTDLVDSKDGSQRNTDFIPDRDISSEAWIRFRDRVLIFDKAFYKEIIYNIFPVSKQARGILDPQSDFFPVYRDELLKSIADNPKNLDSKAFFLARLKLCYPEQPMELDPTWFKQLLSLKKKMLHGNNLDDLLHLIFTLEVLFPEKRAEAALTSDEAEKIIKHIKDNPNILHKNTLLDMKVYFSLLCPEQRTRIDVEGDAQEISDDIPRIGGEIDNFPAPFKVFYLSILTSKRARIDDNGHLVLEHDETPALQDTPEVPVVRRF